MRRTAETSCGGAKGISDEIKIGVSAVGACSDFVRERPVGFTRASRRAKPDRRQPFPDELSRLAVSSWRTRAAVVAGHPYAIRQHGGGGGRRGGSGEPKAEIPSRFGNSYARF